jgi:hypothetical protein
MIGRIHSIVRDSLDVYRVVFATVDGGILGEYVFQIVGSVEMVTWGPEFDSYIGLSPPPLSEVFDAILAFHHAQRIALPPWEVADYTRKPPP